MTAFAELISERSRRLLLDRLAELAEVEHLIEERGQQRPPEPVPSLADLAARDGDQAEGEP